MKRLIGCLFATWIGAVGAAQDDFNSRCGSSLPPKLAPTADTGVVIVDARLRAFAPVEMEIERAIAVLNGTQKGLGSRSSRYECTEFIVIPDLPAGRYRLSSLEGRVSSATLPERFLYPMPGDGYQVVNPHDWREGPQQYRVQPRRAPELEIEVTAGEVSYGPGRGGTQPRFQLTRSWSSWNRTPRERNWPAPACARWPGCRQSTSRCRRRPRRQRPRHPARRVRHGAQRSARAGCSPAPGSVDRGASYRCRRPGTAAAGSGATMASHAVRAGSVW